MTASRSELMRKAQALHAEGRPLQAAKAVAEALQLSPNEPILYHNLAATLGDAGRFAEAIEALEKGFKLGLNAPESLLVYARSLSGVHRYDDAVAAYQRLLARTPIDETTHRELAQLLWMRTNDRDASFVALNRAIQDNPGALSLFVLRAQLYGQTEDARGEYALLEQAIEQFGPQPLLDYLASKAALAFGNVEAGLLHAERLLQKAPQEEKAQAACCAARIAAGDCEGAQNLLSGLINSYPENQYYIALQTTIWRLLEDPRQDDLMNYDDFVFRAELSVPSGWSSLDDYLNDLISALDSRHSFKTHPFFQSVRRGSQISSITEADDPAMRAFPQALEGPKRAFLEQLGSGSDPIRQRNTGSGDLFSAWSVLLPPNGFHINHVHPEGWVSTACHLRFESTPETNPKAGWLKFGEPGIHTPTILEPEVFVQPERGVLVMFPSYMWHGVVPFTQGTDRLTVAGDIVPAASNENQL